MSEAKIWEARPSQWVNVLHWTASVLTLGLWLPVAFWHYLVVRCTEYSLSNQRLLLKSGVFSRTEDDVELYRVKDTRLEQPFFLRVVGLGNIVLITSDPLQPTIVVRAVANAQALREQLRSATEDRRDRKGVREVDYA